jgi:hypothetical protein
VTKLATFVRTVRLPVDRGVRPAELRDHQAAFVEPLAELTPDEAVERLASITALNGENDPAQEAAGLPWEWLLQRLLRSHPQQASRAARRWYSVLVTAEMYGDCPVEHRAFAAYVSGVIEALIGNDLRAERWLETGRAEAEIEEAGIETFERAYRFVRGHLPQPEAPDLGNDDPM